MFRSLHRKLVLILVLLIVSVMAVVGTFLINSINTFYLNSFYEQMQAVFTTDTIRSMQEAAAEPGTDGLKTIIDAHKSRLGIDDYRNYAILDSEGGFLDGSNPNVSVTRTSNVIAAMAGETGTRSAVSDSIMDIAVPLDKNGDGAVDYIVYIADNKREISDLSWRFFQIVMQAMMFGLLAAILLSFLLSKTITTPIERITEGARSIAEGNFDQDLGVQSSDEIGELTRSFNYMAHRLKNTVGEVQGERDKLNTLFLHMTDGVAAFTTDGTLIHMNPATENLLGVRVEQKLSFDEMFADLDMPDTDETVSRSFLTNEITRFGRVLSVTLIGTCYQMPCLFGLVKSGGDISFVFKNDTIFVFLVVLPSAMLASKLGAPAWAVFACLKCDQILKCFVAIVKINRYNWMKNLTRDNTSQEEKERAVYGT